MAFVRRLNKPKIKPPETGTTTMAFPHLVVIMKHTLNCVLNRSPRLKAGCTLSCAMCISVSSLSVTELLDETTTRLEFSYWNCGT